MSPESPEDMLFLYKEDLYLLPDLQDAGPQGSGKKVLALFPGTDLTPETQAMLERMMNACGLGPGDYHLQEVSLSHQVSSFLTRFKPEKAILFGIHLQGEGWQMQRPVNQAFRFAGMRFLPAESLGALLGSNEKKSALWQIGLKPLFDK
jgi:hypothetical protein